MVDQPLQTTAATPIPAAVPSHINYPDSVESSPRSRTTDNWDEPIAPTVAAAKLRLMCSYGGHIVPRPHDKSLCYVGGETRIVVVERHTSLSDLSARLSKTLLGGRPFTLKYQLPNEDLDSLISVTTDEDLDNMVDEYDRMANNSSNNSAKSSRLRLFLFPSKPDASQSMGPILDSSAKSDDWFLNALNSANSLNRGFSDSASVNCLLGLDDDVAVAVNNLDSGARDLEASQPGSFGNGKNGKQGQDIHSVPDSPMLETTSSFGSTSSSPSLANLPPIRVHVDDGAGAVVGGGDGGGVRFRDQKLGIEEQFAHMSFGLAGQKQPEEGFVVISSPPPMPSTLVAAAAPATSAAFIGEYHSQVISDDERSDHGAPAGFRKPSTPQQQALPPQSQQKPAGVVDVPSPDSVSSDSSVNNPLSRSRPVICQDPVVQIPSATTRLPAKQIDPKANVSDPSTRVHIQQVQDSGYVLQSQFEQAQQQQQQQQQQQPQQFIHTGTHYIHQHPAGAMPISAYYQVYQPQQQQQHLPHALEQQYPVYYMPARQPQAYHNLPIQQSNVSDNTTAMTSGRPQASPNPAMVASSAAYNQVRNAPVAKQEMAAGVFRPPTAGAPSLVQVPTSQHQQQFVAYSHIHHPSQPVAPNSSATSNYAYDFADPAHSQIYYTQPLVPSQYQTMAAGAVVLPETSAQFSNDNIKQQMRTSQPL